MFVRLPKFKKFGFRPLQPGSLRPGAIRISVAESATPVYVSTTDEHAWLLSPRTAATVHVEEKIGKQNFRLII